ncbi:MAG: DegT/DnrJ/EryC1/StrS family aminotransferase [Bdellovibrionota bacterium]|nr:MAG: DegT/DnrJ/EryC1/StrS family aminotransferase [Bdellovibrionota bacterium]
MQVPLLDLKSQLNSIESELCEAVLDVIRSCNYIMGPKIAELESLVASYTGSKFAVAVSSGSDALLAALMALNIGPGDLVITSPHSFFASAGAIARLHAKPVFVDIDPKTFNMDPAALEAWFEEHQDKAKDVKAIIPVHLFGQCADMAPILALAERYNIPVVEDAAQAIGARYELPGRGECCAGTMGVMGCLSFFPSKNLGGIGDGGMVLTNEASLAEKLRKLRVHGSQPKYYHSLIGGNFRLDPIQAAALIVKMPYLESWHQSRRQHASFYDEQLPREYIQPPHVAYPRRFHIYNQYVITAPTCRDELRSFLSEKQISTEIYYPVPFHLQECFKYLGYQKGAFPNAEHAALNTFAVPVYPELTSQMQEYVIDAIRQFFVK